MKKTGKSKIVLCLYVMLTMVMLSALNCQAASTDSEKTAFYTLKTATLKTPVLSNWKKTYDSAEDPFTFDGVTYSISWGKVTNATGYQVYYASNDNGEWYNQTTNTKKLKYAINFSHIDIKIKVKVRAYKTVNGRRVYGNWSSFKSKTITYGTGGSGSSTGTNTGTENAFKKLREKGFTYKNSKFSYGVGFGKNNSKVYIGVWNVAGTSSSYEDFLFNVKEGQSAYHVKGMRSGFSYTITLKPYSNYVRVKIKCMNSLNRYFDLSSKKFNYKKNASFVSYANY